jgi:hypothetical protein
MAEEENLKDKNKVLDSGFTRDQTYYALKKARIGYDVSNRENNIEGKKYYAWLIYKRERELGMRAIPLRELKMLALDFYSKNVELFGDEIRGEKVLKVMMERVYMPDKPVK